jgi:hypothetical protein
MAAGIEGAGDTAVRTPAARAPPIWTIGDAGGIIPADLYPGDKYFSGSERKRSLHFGLQKKYAVPLYS